MRPANVRLCYSCLRAVLICMAGGRNPITDAEVLRTCVKHDASVDHGPVYLVASHIQWVAELGMVDVRGAVTDLGMEVSRQWQDEDAWTHCLPYMEKYHGRCTPVFLCSLLSKYGQFPLFAHRVRMGLDLDGVARRAHLHRSSISRLERTTTAPRSQAARISYAAALGWTEEELIAATAGKQDDHEPVAADVAAEPAA